MNVPRFTPVLLVFAAAALPDAAAAKTHVVVLAEMRFTGPPADLKVGDTIEWRNRDIFRHSATARDKSFDVDLPPGATRSTVLRRAGAFAFYCRFHPGMTGTLTVTR